MWRLADWKFPLAAAATGLSMVCSSVAYSQQKPADAAVAQAIEANVRSFIEQHHVGADDIDVRIQPLDSRLSLRACGQDLQSRWTVPGHDTGSTSITVVCQDASGWSVMLRADVDVIATVPVLTRTVKKGERLTASMVRTETRRLSELRSDTLLDLQERDGHEFRRRVVAGQAITESMLVRPFDIIKGRQVAMYAGIGGLKVRTMATALSSAYVGSVVTVRNSTSKRLVQVRVTGHSEVQSLQSSK